MHQQLKCMQERFKSIYYIVIRPLLRRIYYSTIAGILHIISFLLFWIRPKYFDSKQIKRIVLIKMERIGDLVLSTPAITAIRKVFTQSHISIIVNSYTKGLIANDPHIDEVIVYDAGQYKTKQDRKQFFQNLQSKHFDLGVDLTTRDFFLLPAWLLYRSGAGIRVGLDNLGRGLLFHIKVKPRKGTYPYAQEVLHILMPLGIKSETAQPRLHSSEKDSNFIHNLLLNKGIKNDTSLVCIHAGGNFPTQCWNDEGYTCVADYLINQHKAQVCFVGSSKEKEKVKRIIQLMQGQAVNFAGELSLSQLTAFMAQCNLFIGSSSGPLHMAVGFNIPTISILGPTVYQRWSPQGDNHIVLRRNLPCSPCGLDYCWKGDFACMNQIKPQEVIEAVDKQLRKGNA